MKVRTADAVKVRTAATVKVRTAAAAKEKKDDESNTKGRTVGESATTLPLRLCAVCWRSSTPHFFRERDHGALALSAPTRAMCPAPLSSHSAARCPEFTFQAAGGRIVISKLQHMHGDTDQGHPPSTKPCTRPRLPSWSSVWRLALPARFSRTRSSIQHCARRWPSTWLRSCSRRPSQRSLTEPMAEHVASALHAPVQTELPLSMRVCAFIGISMLFIKCAVHGYMHACRHAG